MKRKFNNNKGSTMILLVMSVAVISLLGTSILAVTMMNYKIKKANTDLKFAFYMSESGLDRAYAAAYALILDSVKEANDTAQDKINEFDNEKRMEIILTEDPVLMDKYFEDYENGNFNFRQSLIKSEAKKAFEDTYVAEIKDNIENKLRNSGYGESDDDEVLEIILPSNMASYIASSTFDLDNPLSIPISSEYENKIAKTIKKTNVDIVIGIPDYNKSYTIKTTIMKESPYWTKAMTTENLYINNKGVEFNGEVFVNKDLEIRANAEAEFNKDLAVKNNIEIQTDAVLKTKNLYTNGIYLEGKRAKFIATKEEDSSVEYSGVIVKDDLQLEQEGQEVTINGPYYGFATSEEKRDTKNSAIIINNKDVNLKITGDLFLLGTSYIKELKNPYATGESLSVKGNYIAYTLPLAANDLEEIAGGENLIESNIIFDYESYTPLPRLIEKFADNTNIPVYDKAKYIKAFSKNNSPSLYLGSGKIELTGAMKALHGSAVNNGSIINSNRSLDAMLNMRDNIETSYNAKIDKLGFASASVSEFSVTEIFNKIKNLTSEEKANLPNKIDADGELIYINYVEGTSKYTFPDGVKSGLVITNEDIEISGSVDFTGVIICGGDIIIKDGIGGKIFKYNKGVITTIIAENKLYDMIFRDTQHTGNELSVTTFTTEEDGVNVNFSELLNFENWSIK